MAEKIELLLEKELLEELERVRSRTGESRSAMIRRALEMLLESERRRERVADSIEGYHRRPESEKTVAVAFDRTRAAWSTLDDEEDW